MAGVSLFTCVQLDGFYNFFLNIMKVECKYVAVLLVFAGGHVMLGIPFIKRPQCYHSNMILYWGLLPWPFNIPSAHKPVRLFDP